MGNFRSNSMLFQVGLGIGKLLVVYLFCCGGVDNPLNQVIVLDFLVIWLLTIWLSFTETAEFAARGDHEVRGDHGHSGVHRPGTTDTVTRIP